MLEFAVIFIILTINFLIAYYLGERSQRNNQTSVVGDLFTAIGKKIQPKGRLGAVRRPSPGQVYRRQNPEQLETELEMKKALDDLQEEV